MFPHRSSRVPRRLTSFARRLFALFCVAGLAAASPGQTLFVPNGTNGIGTSANGKVGIGTSNPTSLLTVTGGHGDTQFRLFSTSYGQDENGPNTAILTLWASEPGWTWNGAGIGNNVTNTNGIVRVTNTRGGSYLRLLNNQATLTTVDSQGISRNAIIVDDGKVGIDLVPSAKFDVNGSIAVSGQAVLSADASSIYVGDLMGGDGLRSLVFRTYDLERVRITGDGNVGIGTASPTHKLAVNGTVKAREVIVETTGWSDYVFDEDYRLAPLSEVEAHIREKKHLPGIPSAAQVAEQGVSVGEVQKLLLQKIEELTLHQIRLENELAALKAASARRKDETTGSSGQP